MASAFLPSIIHACTIAASQPVSDILLIGISLLPVCATTWLEEDVCVYLRMPHTRVKGGGYVRPLGRSNEHWLTFFLHSLELDHLFFLLLSALFSSEPHHCDGSTTAPWQSVPPAFCVVFYRWGRALGAFFHASERARVREKCVLGAAAGAPQSTCSTGSCSFFSWMKGFGLGLGHEWLMSVYYLVSVFCQKKVFLTITRSFILKFDLP